MVVFYDKVTKGNTQLMCIMVLHDMVKSSRELPSPCVSWSFMVKSSREIPKGLCIMVLHGEVIKKNTTAPV